MKSIVSVFCLSLLIISPLSAQHAPWEKTAGPPGIEVSVIYETNNIVYAGTKTQGVYKSTDNGSSWVAANSGIELTMVHDLIASGGNLLAAVSSRSFACPGSNNIFKSTDNGVTWSPTSGLSGEIVNSFAIKDSFVYAGFSNLSGSGLWRSSDNGNSWQEVDSPIENGDKIFVSDNAIIVSDDNFIWRSLDDGDSWDLVEQFALSGISSFARAGTRLFAAAGGIMTSEDNGGSWTFSSFPGGAVHSFSSNGSIIYLGSGSKVFKSTNQGANWINVSTGLGSGAIQALLFDGTNLFAGTPTDSAGVYRSTNGGTSWTPAAAGLPAGSTIRSLISFGGFLFAGMNGDGIYRSSDRGDTWTKTDISNSLLAQQLVLDLCVKDNALFAAASNGLYKSTDGGATFQRTLNGFPTNMNVTAFSLTVSSGNIVAAVAVSFSPTSTLHAIFYSSDNGSTWHQANLPVDATSVSSVASDGGPLAYAGVSGQSFSVTGLYKSFDGGVTWVSRTNVMGADIERLAANGSNVLAGGLFTAFYSRDFGELEWAPSTPGSCGFGCGIATYTLRGSSIYAGNTDGMFLSTDMGVSWTPINEGFPDCPKPAVEASCADSDYLFAGTFREGVWRKVIDSVTPSPTPTFTPGVTATPTPPPATPTATPSATATATPSPAATATPSPAATPTPSPTATPTPSATPTATPSPPPATQAINLSTRMRVQTGNNVGIGGFIITGTAPKHLLLRAMGPSLTQLGVPDALADPVLELHGPGGFGTITNNNWRDTQEAQIEATGLAPTNNFESAIDAILTPGAYTALVRGNGDTSGVALVEVYDLGPAVSAKLANISTRAFVSTGDNIVIAGFILGGNSPQAGNDRIITRGIGPSLTALGVPDALANPTLDLRDSNGAVLVMSNDWQDNPAQAAELTAAGLAPTNELESGIAATLPPGLYTALLAGLNNGAGIGLVEVYDRGSP